MVRFVPLPALVLVPVLLGPAPTAPGSPTEPEERIGAPPPPPAPTVLGRKPLPVEPGAEGSLDPRALGLRRRDDGTYEYLDRGLRFSAVIERDGRVRFADRYRRTSSRNRQRGRCCGLPPEGLAGLNPFRGVPVPGLAELIYAMYRIDPNRSAKDAFLERTRAFRTKLAIDFALQNLDRRLSDLDRELLEIWQDDRRPAKERRRILFERWDECDELVELSYVGLPKDAILTIERARMETAERARAKIERFIRKAAPRGSADAYGDEELAALNARRRSRQRFAPYDTAAPRPSAGEDGGTDVR
ncbi:MAG: hypothetical protein D6705_07765 [Deltaproteobacteria bacterium]|nr:MAG: hypothetical protein D6705_07765 [Deltaproteobacteria bacterium]